MLTKTIDKRDDLYRFKIPFLVYFIQSSLDFIISFLLPTLPLFIFILIIFFFRFKINIIILYIVGIVTVIVSLYILLKYYYGLNPTKMKFYRDFREYFYRKFVIDRLRCPDCQGKFEGYKKLKPMAQLFCEYSYLCESCKNEYIPKPVNDGKGLRTLWRLTKFSKSENKTQY